MNITEALEYISAIIDTGLDIENENDLQELVESEIGKTVYSRIIQDIFLERLKRTINRKNHVKAVCIGDIRDKENEDE